MSVRSNGRGDARTRSVSRRGHAAGSATDCACLLPTRAVEDRRETSLIRIGSGGVTAGGDQSPLIEMLEGRRCRALSLRAISVSAMAAAAVIGAAIETVWRPL